MNKIGIIEMPLSLKISIPKAVNCNEVFNLAILDTGTLTLIPARNSLNPETAISLKSIINAGIFLFNEEIFAAIDGIEKSIRGEYELTDALESISDQIHIIDYKGIWKDIGNPWDLITANEEYMKNI